MFCDKNRLGGNSEAEALRCELAFLGMLELSYLGSSLEAWSSVCLCIPQLFDPVLPVGLCFTCRTGSRGGGGGGGNPFALTGLCSWCLPLEGLLEPRASARGE